MTEIEIEYQDNRKGIKIRLKGEQASVDSYLKKYGYDEAMKAFSTPTQPVSSSPSAGQESISNLEIPEKPEAQTLRGYVLALMYGAWGLQGRTSSEILEAAKAHGIGLTINTLSGTLNVLTNSRKLSRKRKPGDTQWVYYPPLSFSLGTSNTEGTGTT